MFSEFDVFILIVLMISTVIGFVRGFIREMLSIAGWIGAGLITYYSFPKLVATISELFISSMVVNIVSIIIVFLVVLGLISVLNAMMLDNLRGFRLGMADRSLGTLFGMLRGVVIVSAIHFMVAIALEEEGKDPEWLKQGETYGLTSFGGEMVRNYAMPYLEELREKGAKKVEEELDSFEDDYFDEDIPVEEVPIIEIEPID